MKLLTIAEIKQLRNKEPIESFRGKVENLYPQKRGTGQYGDWYLQNMIVSDATGKVQATWGGEQNLGDWGDFEGKEWLFESELSEKHGYLGIKWDVRKVNGKTYEGIKLTESCKIRPLPNWQAEPPTHREMEDADPYGQHGEVDGPPPTHFTSTRMPQESPKQAEPVKTAENKPNEDTGVLETRKHLMQSVNLYNLCLDAADTVVRPHLKQMYADHPEITSEQFWQVVGQIYKEASVKRTNDGVNWWSFIDKMPDHPIK